MERNGTQFDERMNIVYFCVIKKVNKKLIVVIYSLTCLIHLTLDYLKLTIILDEVVR